MDLLNWQLSDGVVDQMSSKLEIGDNQKTGSAAKAALSILMSALAKNSASSSSNLSGLMGALDKDHDGSVLDDLVGLLSGQRQASNSRTMNGAGILGHLLGGKQNNVVDMLMKVSGLNQQQSSGLLSQLAPLVLGVLGRVKKQNQMDSTSLSEYIRNSQQTYIQEDKNRSVFEKILDQDGDGSVMDELAGIGMKVLGGFLKR